ncbi:MAG: hypothetical protein ACHREM_01020 [Polyangiales bacterium]
MSKPKQAPRAVQTSIYARTAVSEPAPVTAPEKVRAQGDLFSRIRFTDADGRPISTHPNEGGHSS